MQAAGSTHSDQLRAPDDSFKPRFLKILLPPCPRIAFVFISMLENKKRPGDCVRGSRSACFSTLPYCFSFSDINSDKYVHVDLNLLAHRKCLGTVPTTAPEMIRKGNNARGRVCRTSTHTHAHTHTHTHTHIGAKEVVKAKVVASADLL